MELFFRFFHLPSRHHIADIDLPLFSSDRSIFGRINTSIGRKLILQKFGSLNNQSVLARTDVLSGARLVDGDTVAVHCPKNGIYKGQPVQVSDSVIEMCQQAEKLLKKADNYIKTSSNQFSHVYESFGLSWLGGRRARDLTAKSMMKDSSSVLTRWYKNQGMSCQELSLLMLGLAARETPGTPKGIAYVSLGDPLPEHAMPYLGDHRTGDVVIMDKHARHPIPHLSSLGKFQEGVTFQNDDVKFDDAAALTPSATLNKYAAQHNLPQVDLADPTNRTLVKAIFLDEAQQLANGGKRKIFEQNFSMGFPDTPYKSPNYPMGISFNRMPVGLYQHRRNMQDETVAFIALYPELAPLGFTTDGIDVPNKPQNT